MEQAPYQVLLYYLYTEITDPVAYLDAHRKLCEKLGLLGRIIVAEEGINGTVSGETIQTNAYMEALRADPITKDIEFKVDPAEDHEFPKLSIKCRPEIVSLGLNEDLDPNNVTGQYLSPKEFYEAMQDPEAVILDGRNNYESALGHFKGAVCPDLDNFRDFPEWIRKNLSDQKDRPILTYCTGGIRCEKLSGFLLKEGFENVAQLHGGIVTYGKNEATEGRDFDGSCYVFDQRVTVDVNHTETKKVISRCIHSGVPCDRYVNCGYKPCNDQVFLSEEAEKAFGKYCSDRCRDAQSAIDSAAGITH